MNNCKYIKIKSDGHYTVWRTNCGKEISYQVPEEVGICFAPLPTDNGHKYCSYCGKEIEI